jgi:hypothetical protein
MATPAGEQRSTEEVMTAEDGGKHRLALFALLPALPMLLAHAFVPMEHFVRRSDDAYYYFKVAANYPVTGSWTFDTIHRTNGVQPLWALILSAMAQVMSWVGLTEPDLLARSFVALTAVLHFLSGLLLFHLLARTVSVGTGLAAAGGLLYPVAIVWSRVWGMENSLYALLLTATAAFFQLRFLEAPGPRRAIALGALLGLTALARLNAGLLAACLLLYLLTRRQIGPMAARLRAAVIAGVVASAIVVPYFAYNYAQTHHVMPISSEVKRVQTQAFLKRWGVEGPASPRFAAAVARRFGWDLQWFAVSRAADGLWIRGGRTVYDEMYRIRVLAAALAALVLVPFVFRQPRDWLSFLATRFRRLAMFTYVLVFAALDMALSIALFPNQLSYAAIRWWFAASEIVIVVLVATLAAASISYVARRAIAPARHRPLAAAALAVLVAAHAVAFVRLYWLAPPRDKDWNLSWNIESLLAAQWMAANLPQGALVGSWNAGVLGYYAPQRVVNLDGLINDFGLLPYLRDGQVSRYIERERIEYLSDMDSILDVYKVRGQLELTEVYSHHSELMHLNYRIYRVGPHTLATPPP